MQADQLLRQAGFELLHVSHAERLEQAIHDSSAVEAILLDENALRANETLISQIKIEKPLIKILLIQSRQNKKKSGEYLVLKSPFSPEQLLQSLQKVIA